MVSITDVPVTIQTSAQSVPSTPAWFGEVTLIAHYLKHLGVLAVLAENVRFARSRFGHYDTLDFVVVLLGYAISGERTIEAFYERVQPFATEFMALFGRTRLPHRSTLSRFLEAASVNSGRGSARSLSERGLFSAFREAGATRWVVGSARKCVACLRCRWDATNRSPTSLAAD